MKRKQICLLQFCLAVFLLTGSFAMAQTVAQPNGQTVMNPPGTATTPLQISVTGCLKKGHETGGYFITDQNGNVWELTPGNVNLAEHVNHSVQIAGKPIAASAQQEARMGDNEKREAGGNKVHDLRVVSLKMLSPSCTR